MHNKKMMSVAFVFLLSMTAPTNFVWADEDEYEGYEEHEAYNEHEDHEGEYKEDDPYEDEEYNEDNYEYQGTPVETVPEPAVTWDEWSRTVSNGEGTSPIAISKTVSLENPDGKQQKIYVIPKQGQIMVPAVEAAEFLRADVTFYKTSKITEMQLDSNELIFKSDSNAVYENDVKTPMPVEAMMYQNKLYIPISVLTNGLGYNVTWDETTQTFSIQQ